MNEVQRETGTETERDRETEREGERQTGRQTATERESARISGIKRNYSAGFLPYTFSIKNTVQYILIYVLNNETHLLKNRVDESWRDAENDVMDCDGRVIGGCDRGHDVGQIDVSTLHHLSHEWHVHHAHVKVAEGLHHSSVIAGCNRRFPEISGEDNLTVFSYSGRVKFPEWRWQWRRADLRHFQILRHGPITIYTSGWGNLLSDLHVPREQ